MLEPQRTNILLYSESFDNAYWNKFGSSVASGFTSPDGASNAYKLVDDSANTQHGLLRSNFPINVQRTLSVFAKKGENDRVFISDYNKFGATIGVIFNLSSGIVESNQNNSVYLNPKIESYLNGWYKCSVTWTNTTGLTVPFFGNAISGTNSYQGDGVSGIYVFGATFEEESYATSYIPTQGSAVTRVAETASGSGNSEVFNDSEGVLFADIGSFVGADNYRQITISDGSTNNYILIGLRNDTGNIYADSSSSSTFLTDVKPINSFAKCAFKYKVNDFSFWLNGFKVGVDTTTSVPVGLDTLNFGIIGVNDFYGKTKELGYYDTILTDLELETLTSYKSWTSMVNELNLNIIYNG